MSQSGYSSTTRNNLALGSGLVVYNDGTNTYKRLGITQGGVQWDNGKVVKQVAFDELITAIRGLEYVTGFMPKISATFKEFSTTLLQFLEHGQTFSGSPSTLTPKSAMTLFTANASTYLQDLRFMVPLGDGTTWQTVRFPWALATYQGYQSQDKDEATLPVVFEARLEPAGSPLDLTVAPYLLERITSPTFA